MNEFVLQLLKYGLLALVLLLALYFLVKKLLLDDSGRAGEGLKKQLMNYFSNDEKANSYDTFSSENDKGTSEKKASAAKDNWKDQEKKHLLNEESLNYDQYTSEKTKKVCRFVLDYCRASPFINLVDKNLLSIGWRNQKYTFDVEFKNTFNGELDEEIASVSSLMTILPANKSFLNLEDDITRNSLKMALTTLKHDHILPFLSVDILHNQLMITKIQKKIQAGSLKDIIYKTSPFDAYNKKYPTNTKGKPLHFALICSYGKQILEGLRYLHKNRWYHMHLHSGNVLIDKSSDSVLLSDLENFMLLMPHKNENFLSYAYDNICTNEDFIGKSENTSILSEIFKNNCNIFEKIDIICFGRILYEMATGRELKAPFPDESEYKDLEAEIADVLRTIFKKKSYYKISKIQTNSCDLPDVSAADLLKHKLFTLNDISNINNSSFNEIDVEFDNNTFSSLKEQIFDQTKYLKLKMKMLYQSKSKVN